MSIFDFETVYLLFLGRKHQKVQGDEVKTDQPIVTRVQVKKNLLRNVGNAKQCKLCDKIFSTEKSAVAHVFEVHNDLLQPEKMAGKRAEEGEFIKGKRSIETTNLCQPRKIIDYKRIDNKEGNDNKWKCKYCSSVFLCLADTVPHMKQMHGITRPDAREKSLKKIL